MDDYDNIYLVDSLSATAGERLLVLEAVRLREAGASAADIAAALENLKGRIRIWAGLDTLEYLQKGGRLSRTAAEIGTIAHMKPVVAVTQTGEVTVVKKCIGRRRAIEQVEKLLLATPPDPNFPLFTLYAHERENCEQLNERLRATSITPTASVNIGPTIGTHIGIGACGVAYIAKE
jgi:DegV family protein with EDD domain